MKTAQLLVILVNVLAFSLANKEPTVTFVTAFVGKI